MTDHARERARERFPGFKAARIVDDVRAALCEGRIAPGGEEGLLHVWTADESRVYALRVKANALLVVTALPPEKLRVVRAA